MKYLIFMKNYKGDEYKVVPKVLKELRDTLKDFITIHFPGYMSKTKDNIDDFKTHFFEPENKHYFFLKGMNGDVKLISSEKTNCFEKRFKAVFYLFSS